MASFILDRKKPHSAQRRGIRLDRLLQPNKPPPIMLLQQPIRLLIRNLTQIPATLPVLGKTLTGILFSQNSQDIVPVERLRKSEKPLAIAARVHESNDVQFRRVPHVDEPLRRHAVEDRRVAFVQPYDEGARARRVFRARLQDRAEIRIGEHGGDLEGWGGFFHDFPDGALGMGFGGAVDGETGGVGFVGGAAGGVVPGVWVDFDDFVRFGEEGGGAAGGVDYRFDACLSL